MENKTIVMEPEVDKKFNLRLETRVKNGSLVQARENLGITQKRVAEEIGIAPSTYSDFERLRRYPSKKNQKKICDFYRKNGIALFEEDVFPQKLRQSKIPSKYTLNQEIPASRLIPYMRTNQKALTYTHVEEELTEQELKTQIKNALNTLTQRDAKVIELYFGLGENPDPKYFKNMESISKKLGLTGSRIGQIKEKAIGILKHPSTSKKLEEFI